MPRLCINSRKRVIALLLLGYTPPDIYKRLVQENEDITLRAIYYLVKKYHTKGKYLNYVLQTQISLTPTQMNILKFLHHVASYNFSL